ncbi:MAG: uracil-DNA glycosylase family 4 [Candidatus Omnitrophota bacterium]|jgi:uracil-DNA glycosylase family 4
MSVSKKENSIIRLCAKIAKCTDCSLHEARTNTVTGAGTVDTKIMFIGEAPGKKEDEQGRPFIGRAGDIFSSLLASVGITRDDIYLCNTLKCRPPKNRNPAGEETIACAKHLDAQIKIINPEVIGTLGQYSTNYVFKKFDIPLEKITKVAGQIIEVETKFGLKKIVPVFHPAVAIYNVHRTDELMAHFQVFKQFK